MYMYDEIFIHIHPQIDIHPFRSLAMFSVSEHNFAYYRIYKNRAVHFTNTYWFPQYYFTYIIYMCIYTHTYEYTYMYSINSSVYYDVRDSIPIHMYMTILSRIYTYIYAYLYMYIYIYIYTYTHTYTYVLWMHCPCPISSCPSAFSPPFSVQSLACPPTVLPAFIWMKSCPAAPSPLSVAWRLRHVLGPHPMPTLQIASRCALPQSSSLLEPIGGWIFMNTSDLSGRSDGSRMRKQHQVGQKCTVVSCHVGAGGFTTAVLNK